MKLLSICLMGLMSSSVFASDLPGVGSYAQYSLTTSAPGQAVVHGSQIDTIQSIDNSDLEYDFVSVITLPGKAPQHSAWTESTTYFSNQVYFIQHCSANGGDLQTVVLPSGRFPTCHIAVTNPDRETLRQEVWLDSDLPLFTVKQITQLNDGKHTVRILELQTSVQK